MKKIQILGPGCQKCKKLATNTEAAVRELGLRCEIEKVTNIDQIVASGAMLTPAIAVDGEIKATGRILSVKELKDILA